MVSVTVVRRGNVAAPASISIQLGDGATTSPRKGIEFANSPIPVAFKAGELRVTVGIRVS